jgi:hypothetical protein
MNAVSGEAKREKKLPDLAMLDVEAVKALASAVTQNRPMVVT